MLTVLWIGSQDTVENLNDFARKNNVQNYLFDDSSSVSKKFGMTYGGGIVFINRDGVVKSRIPKGFSESRLETELKKIL